MLLDIALAGLLTDGFWKFDVDLKIGCDCYVSSPQACDQLVQLPHPIFRRCDYVIWRRACFRLVRMLGCGTPTQDFERVVDLPSCQIPFPDSVVP